MVGFSAEASTSGSSATVSEDSPDEFEFKSDMSQKAFNYLVSSFAEDYMRRKLSLENSGWRTLTEIIKQGNVAKFSVYGNSHHKGQALSELERRGLVEVRVFLGERGRGGRKKRARLCYDKQPIRRHVDQHILKNK
jgi:hypothetical protein